MASQIRDTNLKVTKALPAAAATANSDSIDLLDSAPGVKMRDAELEVVVPALPDLVDDKTCIVTVQDSADDSTFAAVAELSTITLTGASGAGAAAVTRRYKLPETIRRYVRVSAAILTGGGDNTAKSVEASIVY